VTYPGGLFIDLHSQLVLGHSQFLPGAPDYLAVILSQNHFLVLIKGTRRGRRRCTRPWLGKISRGCGKTRIGRRGSELSVDRWLCNSRGGAELRATIANAKHPTVNVNSLDFSTNVTTAKLAIHEKNTEAPIYQARIYVLCQLTIRRNDHKFNSHRTSKLKSITTKDGFAKSKLIFSLDYIFGKGTSKKVDFEKITFQYSRRTGRLKYVTDKSFQKILFTFRANGTIAPTLLGAQMLISTRKLSNFRSRPPWTITVLDGVSEFISNGRTVFCKHVVHCSSSLLPGEDVAVLNESGKLLAMGKSILAGSVLKEFKRGAAVKIREGAR
jgi:uncharacterized protein with predicted RNA binding PUA domain